MKVQTDNFFWWNIALTWGTVIVIILAIALALLFSGCEMLRDHQDEIREQIITYIETQAERIKAAIPKGIDKVKEVLQ